MESTLVQDPREFGTATASRGGWRNEKKVVEVSCAVAVWPKPENLRISLERRIIRLLGSETETTAGKLQHNQVEELGCKLGVVFQGIRDVERILLLMRPG